MGIFTSKVFRPELFNICQSLGDLIEVESIIFGSEGFVRLLKKLKIPCFPGFTPV